MKENWRIKKGLNEMKDENLKNRNSKRNNRVRVLKIGLEIYIKEREFNVVIFIWIKLKKNLTKGKKWK